MIARLFPFPLASAALFVYWLLLNQTISLGHVIIGCAVAVAGGLTLRLLELPRARIRRASSILRLLSRVLSDVVRSNVAVARILLGLQKRRHTPGFVNIALDLRDPYALAVLATIITATPGTVWTTFDSSKGILTIHVLDLVDEDSWRRTIKQRYERYLLEIFA